ncbi:MAG: hypothetical protein K0R50_4201, partial [Eubacterium sp.]|nr:hypothetical protein [Eubacterium sp.]
MQEYDVYIIPLKWKVIYCFLAA